MIDSTQAVLNPGLFRNYFEPVDSWANWFVIYKVLFGEKLNDSELEVYRQLTGAAEQSFEKVREIWICAGRRSGKSRSAGFLAVFLSLFFDWKKRVKPGEKPYVFIISPNRDQGQIIMGYVRELLNLNDMLKKQIKREFKESIELLNGITISIKTASWRSTRGFSALACVLEECNFFRYELESAVRDKEIYRSVMPMLATFQDSLLISISSPASPQGLMHEKFQKHWSKPGRVLCVRAQTLFLNPTFDKGEVDQAYIDDPEAARSEYGAEWRQGTSSLIDPERLQAVIDKGIIERPPIEGVRYYAFVDASAGKRDSFCLGISHVTNEGQIILDLCREAKPPFRPRDICEIFSTCIKSYFCSTAAADAMGGEWVNQEFAEFGIQIEKARMTKSDYYLSLLPIINNGNCRILGQDRLTNQLLNLERRTRSAMRDSVDVFAGHDDMANVCAGSIVEASFGESNEGYAGFSKHSFYDVGGREDGQGWNGWGGR